MFPRQGCLFPSPFRLGVSTQWPQLPVLAVLENPFHTPKSSRSHQRCNTSHHASSCFMMLHPYHLVASHPSNLHLQNDFPPVLRVGRSGGGHRCLDAGLFARGALHRDRSVPRGGRQGPVAGGQVWQHGFQVFTMVFHILPSRCSFKRTHHVLALFGGYNSRVTTAMRVAVCPSSTGFEVDLVARKPR